MKFDSWQPWAVKREEPMVIQSCYCECRTNMLIQALVQGSRNWRPPFRLTERSNSVTRRRSLFRTLALGGGGVYRSSLRIILHFPAHISVLVVSEVNETVYNKTVIAENILRKIYCRETIRLKDRRRCRSWRGAGPARGMSDVIA